MGTWVAIEAQASQASDLDIALESAMSQVDRVDRLMHPTRHGSDLARISGANPGEPTVVDPWTFAVLRQAAQLNLQTGGLFDPCLASRVGRMPDLVLREPGIVECKAPLAVDLGGIAKGFAIDRAVEALLAHECVYGLVNAGGDLRVFGTPHAIQVRTSSTEVLQVELVDAALAASAPRSTASPSGHLGYYLGTTGETIEGRQVAIVAPQAMVADALCKCVMFCPPAVLSTLLERYGARLLHGR
jgi:FAD:protein FMN transferase